MAKSNDLGEGDSDVCLRTPRDSKEHHAPHIPLLPCGPGVGWCILAAGGELAAGFVT